MASLYELNAEWGALVEAYALADTPEEQQAALEALADAQGDFEDKAEAYARVRQNALADAEAYRAEADRLTGLARKAEALADRLRGALLLSCKERQMVKGDKVKTSIGVWTLRENPWSVKVLDERRIAPEFMKQPAPVVDKGAILARFKDTGEVPEGVDVVRDMRIDFK